MNMSSLAEVEILFHCFYMQMGSRRPPGAEREVAVDADRARDGVIVKEELLENRQPYVVTKNVAPEVSVESLRKIAPLRPAPS